MKLHLDFETYSETDLAKVGAMNYALHPSTDIICMAYAINNEPVQLWTPHKPLPDVIAQITPDVLLEAWNSFFERAIWKYVGVRYGFPQVYASQWRCTMARARAYGLPGALDDAAKVLGTKQKNPAGKKLIEKYSKPNKKTGLRIEYDSDIVDFYEYCKQDVTAERLISHAIPELEPKSEFKFWQADQEINWRGVAIDGRSVGAIIKLIEQAEQAADAELHTLTQGAVSTAHEVKKLKDWVNSRLDEHTQIRDLTKDTVATLLTEPECNVPDDVRRVLEIRQGNSLISVKKVYAMADRSANPSNRAHGLFMYHGARTGRAAGSSIQPQNFPNSGVTLNRCTCRIHTLKFFCPSCFNTELTPVKWSHEIAEHVLQDVRQYAELDRLNYFYGDIMPVLPGCLRSLITATPGKTLMGADYSAIEAVVLAALAGEEWRLEVFRTHGMIYEESASRITGVPFSEFLDYKKRTSEDHPLRKKIGKVAELASGYQGWIGSWKQFGADQHLTDEEIERSVKAWRDASPKIVEFWKKMEACVRLALTYPDLPHPYRSISWIYDSRKNVLFCVLPSGRKLAYHKPRIENIEIGYDDQIVFEGWNTNPKYGKSGWVSIPTYGGKLTENITQAVARDILAHAIVELESQWYPVVLHVHDEIVVEVDRNASVQTFAKIMGTLPSWACDYPLRVGTPWVGSRFRK